jgi:hypothetical protein
MRGTKKLLVITSFSAIFAFACQKDAAISDADKNSTREQTSSNLSLRLSYGDTVFYLKKQPGNYMIMPVAKPTGTGYFKAIPKGLVLDTVSGLINVTQSETGLRYKVYYVSPSGILIDSIKIVISGIDYKDAIYEIASTPNVYDTAFPVYNAKPVPPLPCGDDDEDDDGDVDDDDNTCVFDETDLDDDGNDDIPGVIQDKLLVDIKKGTIDVEASFHAGIFGSSNPANGVNKNFTFYYRLQDASSRALNRITVRVYHFRTRADIPQTLLDTISMRNNIAQHVNSRTGDSQNGNPAPRSSLHTREGSGGIVTTTGLFSFFEYESRPKRPPIIIIVSQ